MISCKLIRHTPDPDRTVAMSAHLCYSPKGTNFPACHGRFEGAF